LSAIGQYCRYDPCTTSDEVQAVDVLAVPPYDGILETWTVTFPTTFYNDHFYLSRGLNEPIYQGSMNPGDTVYVVPAYTLVMNSWHPRKTTSSGLNITNPGLCTNIAAYPQCDFNDFLTTPCVSYSGWRVGNSDSIHIIRRQPSCNTGVASCVEVYNEFVNCPEEYGVGSYPRQADVNDNASWMCYNPCDISYIDNSYFGVNKINTNNYITNFEMADTGCAVVKNEIIENQSQSILDDLNGVKIKSKDGDILAVFSGDAPSNTKLYLKGTNINQYYNSEISCFNSNFHYNCYGSLRGPPFNYWTNEILDISGLGAINLNNPQDVFIIKNGSGSIIGFIDQQGNFATIGKITVNNAG